MKRRPKFFEVQDIESLLNTDHMKSPLIIKPRFEDSSKGLSENLPLVIQEAFLEKHL